MPALRRTNTFVTPNGKILYIKGLLERHSVIPGIFRSSNESDFWTRIC